MSPRPPGKTGVRPALPELVLGGARALVSSAVKPPSCGAARHHACSAGENPPRCAVEQDSRSLDP